MRRPTGGRGRPCPHSRASGGEPDRVVRRVLGGEPMTVGQLRRAAAVLARHTRQGRMDVVVALVRVAVRLEQLGA
jgi:hypothetical protein